MPFESEVLAHPKQAPMDVTEIDLDIADGSTEYVPTDCYDSHGFPDVEMGTANCAHLVGTPTGPLEAMRSLLGTQELKVPDVETGQVVHPNTGDTDEVHDEVSDGYDESHGNEDIEHGPNNADTDEVHDEVPDGCMESHGNKDVEHGQDTNAPTHQSEGSLGSSELARRISKLSSGVEKGIVQRREAAKAASAAHDGPLAKAKQFIVWSTTFLFSVASSLVLVFWLMSKNSSLVATFFVASIAAIAYFFKALHLGHIHLGEDDIPYVRYADWFLTTPLMLYELCHIGHAETHVVIMVIGCDLMMLAFGIIGAIVQRAKQFRLKYLMFCLGCLFYVLMLYTLQEDVANGSVKYLATETQNLFNQLKVLMAVLWTTYPIIVLLGRAHLGIISYAAEDISLCVVDVVSKIGMEGIIVAHALLDAGSHRL